MRSLLPLLFFPLALACSAAETIASADSSYVASPRPKIALVLSGGGARGFAHVGALKVLRELKVPIDMVVGTSMGAVVGGAYAAGYTVENLESLMNETSWDDVFTTKAPRQDMDFRRKDEDNQTIGRFAFGLTREGLVFPRATFSSHVLEEMLRRIATPSLEVDSLDDLALPFRSVATDLYSGEFVVLQRTSLFNAMRASMSIPGAFAPLPLGEALLVDGGLARNLPIDVARKMGADIIIAVNVGTPLRPPDQLNSALDIAQQMINILTEQNVKQSLTELTPRDILISPRLTEVTFTDFAYGGQIVARGEEATRIESARLKALALPTGEYRVLETKRTARLTQTRGVRIADVKVQGTERSNPDILKRALGIVPGESIDDTELAARIRRLGAGGDFERINFRLQGSSIERALIVQPSEVEWGGNTLRFGMRLQSDFKNTNQFDLLAAHTLTWVNSYAAEWRNTLQVGSKRRFETELYQPVSLSRDWFASTGFAYRATDIDLFENGRRATRVGTSDKKVGLYFGRQLGLIGEFRAGRTLHRASAEALLPAAIGEASTARYFTNEAQLRFDTHDSAYFPRSGYQLIALAQRAQLPLGTSQATSTRGVGGSWAISSGPYTLFSVAQYTENDRGGADPIGGFLRLSGTATNSIVGDKTAFGRVIGFKRVGQLPGALGGSIYAGLSLEAGRGYSRDEKFAFGGLKRAAALVVGMETIVGPFYFGVGKTAGGGSAAYLNLGQPQ